MQEKIIEQKTCKHCSTSFEITDKDLEFYEKVSPTFGSKKFIFKIPTLCPDCRKQRRLVWRNEKKLYHRKSDFSGNQIISVYSPDKPYKVFSDEEWWSDKWNPLDYGSNFDFSKTFFEQFDELNKKTPAWGLMITNDNENSPFTSYTAKSKSVYMCGDCYESENTYYSTTIKKLTNCLDCYDLEKSENCYFCSFSRELFNCKYVNYSKSCSNSSYLYDCQGVKNSMFCVGLRNKEYCFLNKEYSREDYESITKRMILKEGIELYNKILINHPRKENININCEDCLGDNLIDSSKSYYCFDSISTNNSKYVSVGHTMDYCMDINIHNPDCLYDYEAISGGKLTGCAFNILGWGGKSMYYNFSCIDCENCFGCVGLRNKKYCILNKQYSREEYEVFASKIVEHMVKTEEWGEFFPVSISPFGYNETLASEYYHLEKEDAIKLGFKWSDYEKQNGYNGEFYSPLKISDYNEKIVGKETAEANILKALSGIIKCEKTGKPFRLVKAELEFYIKNNIEIPKIHPDERHLDRLKLRNPRKLFDRKCDKCGKDIKTTYSPDRKEIVYCESCYEKEVY